MPLAEGGVRKHLRDTAARPFTPFDDDLDIEYGELATSATTLYDGGIRMFLTLTNISGYYSLTRQGRVNVTVTAIDTLPSDAYVLADVGGNMAGVCELIDAYDRIGTDGIMVVPPDHTYVHEHGLPRYYEKLVEASTAPPVSYVRGFNPSINYLRDPTGPDDAAGIKYITGDAVKLDVAASTTDDGVVWVDGLVESFAVSFWNEGIEGFSAGVNNLRPEVGLTLLEVSTEENWGRARELQNICLPYQNFRDQTGQNNSLDGATSVPAVKKEFELAGLRGGVAREPIRLLSADGERRAEELYDQLDDNIECLIG